MKKTTLNMLAIVVVTILFANCRKDDKITKVEDTFDGIMAANKSKEQIFNVNVSTGGSIQGVDGTKITFPPNFAVNANGSAFTGDATVVLQESRKKSQWLADGLSTTTQIGLLLSGGMINLQVMRKDNGAILIPSPAMAVPASGINNLAGKIVAEMPKAPSPLLIDQQLFLPDTPRAPIQGQPAPDPVSTSTLPVLAWQNSTYYPFGSGPNGYIFQLPKFKWANCDQLWNVPGTKTTVTVSPNMANFAGATGLQAMLVYAGTIQTVCTLVPQSNGTIKSYNTSIPMTQACDVVLIGKAADGKILFKVVNKTGFTANETVTITPDIVPGSTVQNYLNSVN